MYEVILKAKDGTTHTVFTSTGDYEDEANYLVLVTADALMKKGVSDYPLPKVSKIEETVALIDFKPKAVPGKTTYKVLVCENKDDRKYEILTVKAGSPQGAYAMVMKQTSLTKCLKVYVYDTAQKPGRVRNNSEINLSKELRTKMEEFIERCDYYRNCYFWTPSGNSSERARQSSKFSIPEYRFVVNGDYYSMEFELDVHCTYVKATSYIKKNGRCTTLTTLKTILRKDIDKDIGCVATPEPQAS